MFHVARKNRLPNALLVKNIPNKWQYGQVIIIASVGTVTELA